MSMVGTILAMATVTFAVRLAGLLAPTRRVPAYGRRFLAYVPIAVFAALIVPGLPGTDASDTTWRIAAGAVTGFLAWRTRAFAPGMLAGLALYLVVRAVNV